MLCVRGWRHFELVQIRSAEVPVPKAGESARRVYFIAVGAPFSYHNAEFFL